MSGMDAEWTLELFMFARSPSVWGFQVVQFHPLRIHCNGSTAIVNVVSREDELWECNAVLGATVPSGNGNDD